MDLIILAIKQTKLQHIYKIRFFEGYFKLYTWIFEIIKALKNMVTACFLMVDWKILKFCMRTELKTILILNLNILRKI